MKNEGKIVELLAEMVQKQDRMVGQIDNLNSEMIKVNSEMVKLNLQTSENTRAIFTLAERLENIVDHEKRISKLESIVLK